MRWLLAAYCGLALVYSIVPTNANIYQKPRFHSQKQGRFLILCLPKPDRADKVEWYKASNYDDHEGKRQEVPQIQRAESERINASYILFFKDLKEEDNGVYFCKMNGKWGPGTQLLVPKMKAANFSSIQYRTNMKDALIVIQGLLLAACVAAVMMRKRTLSEKRDSIYEEPDTDHIYEGLAIETCDGGLYEELSVYAQAEGAEAPWEN